MSYAPRYEGGNWIALCDACGRKFKAATLQMRWDNLMVCPDDFEQRQPQDFVRASVDKIAVPWARSEPADSFTIFCTPNGNTAYPSYAQPGCCYPSYVSSGFDPTLDN